MGRRKGIPGIARDLGIRLPRQRRPPKVGSATGCCAPFVAMVLVATAIGAGLLSIGDAWAHSGGLDSKGCHHDRKNGGYHCHRPQAQPQPQAAPSRANLRDGEAGEQARSFANCSEARAAGAAPVRRGDPGYSRKLDRDGDGVGCE